jgi:hypothetical protein
MVPYCPAGASKAVVGDGKRRNARSEVLVQFALATNFHSVPVQ